MNPKIADTIARECIGVRLRLLNRVITKIYDDSLRSLGLRTSQLNILVVIASLGRARPGEVSDLLKMEISTVSRNLDRMRSRGWVGFTEDEKDARAHNIHLTKDGRQLLERASPAWEKAQDQVKDLLSESGVSAVVNAAEKVRKKY